MKRVAWYAALALLAGLPIQAMAQDGYVTGNVNLRAGPDIDYPAIDMIPAGAPVGIEGCTDGWEWCDVMFGNERGWVAGDFIQDEYNDQQVLVPTYGARLGIPIVTFSIANYWDRYYVDRPFYREREQWYRRPPPHHAPPRPARRPAAHPEHRADGRWNDDRSHGRAAPPQREATPARAAYAPHAPAHRSGAWRQAPPRGQEAHPQRPPTADHAMPEPHGAPTVPARSPPGHAPTDHRTGTHRNEPHPPPDHGTDDRHGH